MSRKLRWLGWVLLGLNSLLVWLVWYRSISKTSSQKSRLSVCRVALFDDMSASIYFIIYGYSYKFSACKHFNFKLQNAPTWFGGRDRVNLKKETKDKHSFVLFMVLKIKPPDSLKKHTLSQGTKQFLRTFPIENKLERFGLGAFLRLNGQVLGDCKTTCRVVLKYIFDMQETDPNAVQTSSVLEKALVSIWHFAKGRVLGWMTSRWEPQRLGAFFDTKILSACDFRLATIGDEVTVPSKQKGVNQFTEACYLAAFFPKCISGIKNSKLKTNAGYCTP